MTMKYFLTSTTILLKVEDFHNPPTSRDERDNLSNRKLF